MDFSDVARMNAAMYGSEHRYTNGGNFEPHEWVLRAMAEVYERAFAEGKIEGYGEGYADAQCDAEAEED